MKQNAGMKIATYARKAPRKLILLLILIDGGSYKNSEVKQRTRHA